MDGIIFARHPVNNRKGMKINKTVVASVVIAVLVVAAIPPIASHFRQKPQQPTALTQKENKKMNVTDMTTQMFKERIMDYTDGATEWHYKGTRPAIIDFYATWCGPCKAMAPIVERTAEKYAGQIDFYRVDIDQEEELAAIFGIQSIPTLLFIPKEGTPQRAVGAMGQGQLEQAIKEVLL